MRVVETKVAGDAKRGGVSDPRGQRRPSTPSPAARCSTPSRRSAPTNAQGERYLPDVIGDDRPRAFGDDGRGPGRGGLVSGVNDRAELATVARGGTTPNPTPAHARGGDDRAACDDEHRRRRRDRRGHGDRALHPASRCDGDRGATAGSGRTPCLARRLGRPTARASGRSPTCGPAPCSRRAPRRGRSWRSRTRGSARARRFRICPMSATPTSASRPTSAQARSPPITTAKSEHRTTIGARVHGGVDTSFVAPVTVGDDAWTAAGSVVTGDVPAGALAVARARQRNVERYAERRENG